MNTKEKKEIESVIKKFENWETGCMTQMAWCHEHNFLLENMAMDYKRKAYSDCRMELRYVLNQLIKKD